MTYDADAITARRKLRRSVTLWRVLAVLGGLFALGAIILAASGGVLDRRGDHIARIEVDGLITGDAKTLKMLEQIEKADRVKALIVSIDSPGGTTAGSEAIYEWLRKIAAKKPVVSTMGTVAASGGYITAIGTDYIVARGNTITGSIGVIFQWADLEKLLQTVGVQMEEVKSGELKAEPNFFGPPSEKVLAVTNEMVQDSYRWFTGLVHERRGIEEQKIVDMQGRVFTGRQALKEKLVDAIGGEEVAVKWLQDEKKVPKLRIVDWKPNDGFEGFGIFSMASAGLEFAGFPTLAKLFDERAQSVHLDGLLSLWQARP
ncbi:MAG: signal peptide peptidase SppA [Hyphomicrobiales bacterium]